MRGRGRWSVRGCALLLLLALTITHSRGRGRNFGFIVGKWIQLSKKPLFITSDRKVYFKCKSRARWHVTARGRARCVRTCLRRPRELDSDSLSLCLLLSKWTFQTQRLVPSRTDPSGTHWKHEPALLWRQTGAALQTARPLGTDRDTDRGTTAPPALHSCTC